MVDFGTYHSTRPLQELLTKKLRPGDIYTHAFSGLRNELVRRQAESRLHRGPQARSHFRCRPWRRKFSVACGRADR